MDIRIDPSSTASWQGVIHDALYNCHYNLSEDLESYLVFLLIRFTTNVNLAGSILALESLEAHQLSGANQKEHLREIGDKCLLFAGFYPEQAHKKLVSLPYFVNLGRGAYDEMATHINSYTNNSYSGLNKLFKDLALNFVKLLNILQKIKLLDQTHSWVPDAITLFETKMLETNQIIINQNIH